MKQYALIAVLGLFAFSASSQAQQKLPENFHPEGDRDTNLFQIEPTILNERFYTSGKVEDAHHFNLNTLPPGAPIPDNDPAEPIKKPEAKPNAKESMPPSAKPSVSTEVKPVDSSK